MDKISKRELIIGVTDLSKRKNVCTDEDVSKNT